MSQHRVAGIVLAAGSSRRFGQPKQLLAYRGGTLVGRAADVAARAGLSPLVVVTTDALRDRVTDALQRVAPPPMVIVNPLPEDGLGSSLRVGARALPDGVEAVVVFVVDQPLVTVDLVQCIVQEWQDGRGRIVRPVSGHVQGHPVLFDGAFLEELRAASGIQAGRDIVAAHEGDLRTISVDDSDLLFDIDTPDDYMRLLRLEWRSGRSVSS